MLTKRIAASGNENAGEPGRGSLLSDAIKKELKTEFQTKRKCENLFVICFPNSLPLYMLSCISPLFTVISGAFHNEFQHYVCHFGGHEQIERFSIERHETKTKVITTANQNNGKHHKSQ